MIHLGRFHFRFCILWTKYVYLLCTLKNFLKNWKKKKIIPIVAPHTVYIEADPSVTSTLIVTPWKGKSFLLIKIQEKQLRITQLTFNWLLRQLLTSTVLQLNFLTERLWFQTSFISQDISSAVAIKHDLIISSLIKTFIIFIFYFWLR